MSFLLDFLSYATVQQLAWVLVAGQLALLLVLQRLQPGW